MANKYKCISHVERLNNSSLLPSLFCIRIPHTIYVREQRVAEDTGIVYYELNKKVIEPFSSQLSKYKVSDFSIENLRVTGTLDTLNFVSVSRDNLSQSSNLLNVAKSIVED